MPLLLDFCASLFLVLILIQESRSRMGMDDDLDYMEDVIEEWYPDPTLIPSLKEQSPINLVASEAQKEFDTDPLVFDGHWHLNPKIAMIRNSGSTAEIGEPSNKVKHPVLHGGFLKGNFVFSQAHFHWGETSDVGSEHTINGIRYSLEVHLVHHHSKYKTIKEARGHENGILVVAFLFKVVPRVRRHNLRLIHLITHHLEQIEENYEPHHAEPNILMVLEEIAAIGEYFYYIGSLTTEPFSENVQWLVFSPWYPITESEMDKFRNLRAKNGSRITSNWRRLQPLNHRKVRYVRSSDDRRLKGIRLPIPFTNGFCSALGF